MVIMPDALPGLKRFLKPVGLNERMMALAIRCIAAFVMHLGRILMATPAQRSNLPELENRKCAA
jgi:hypothetical protein